MEKLIFGIQTLARLQDPSHVIFLIILCPYATFYSVTLLLVGRNKNHDPQRTVTSTLQEHFYAILPVAAVHSVDYHGVT